MAYASVSDLQSRMRDKLSPSESSVAAVLLEDASSIIEEYAGPDVNVASAERICCSMVARAMRSMVGADSYSLSQIGIDSPFANTSVYGASGDLYLTRQERDALNGSCGESVISTQRTAR